MQESIAIEFEGDPFSLVSALDLVRCTVAAVDARVALLEQAVEQSANEEELGILGKKASGRIEQRNGRRNAVGRRMLDD